MGPYWMPSLQEGVEMALRSHDRSLGVARPAQGLDVQEPLWLSAAAISQMLKSALSLEVECAEIISVLSGKLRMQRWRQRALAALKPGSKHGGEFRRWS